MGIVIRWLIWLGHEVMKFGLGWNSPSTTKPSNLVIPDSKEKNDTFYEIKVEKIGPLKKSGFGFLKT